MESLCKEQGFSNAEEVYLALQCRFDVKKDLGEGPIEKCFFWGGEGVEENHARQIDLKKSCTR